MSELIPAELEQARERFGELVEAIRPDLHRYCARMVGSPVDGEDVVQETLARAYYALSMMRELPNLRPWLFRIAHNKAIDHLRASDRRHDEPLDPTSLPVAEEVPLDQRELAALAMSLYLRLTALQRGCVILKDVLGYSLEEIAETLRASLPAIKAALHRGRARLRTLAGEGLPSAPPQDGAEATLLARYVERFNARDWDALRDMLADDVQVELVARGERSGAKQAGDYFTNYSARTDWQLALGRVEGRLAVVVFDRTSSSSVPAYFILIRFDDDDRVLFVRDFRYARYVMRDVRLG